ncbi:MAG: hypothetical protein J07HX5_00287 [halophilic archaeon J07HX5]|nr:MAG: hypothetical protein J07HX5_00287 [halophilic archaeon J07HX5]
MPERFCTTGNQINIMTEPDVEGDDSIGGSTGSISVHDPTEAISVRDPVEELHDPTERFEQTRPDEQASSDAAEAAVKSAFWRLVLALDLGLAAFPLGTMLIWFRGDWSLGGPLVAAGVVVLGYAGYRYTTLRRRLNADESDVGVDEGSA